MEAQKTDQRMSGDPGEWMSWKPSSQCQEGSMAAV